MIDKLTDWLTLGVLVFGASAGVVVAGSAVVGLFRLILACPWVAVAIGGLALLAVLCLVATMLLDAMGLDGWR